MEKKESTNFPKWSQNSKSSLVDLLKWWGHYIRISKLVRDIWRSGPQTLRVGFRHLDNGSYGDWLILEPASCGHLRYCSFWASFRFLAPKFSLHKFTLYIKHCVKKKVHFPFLWLSDLLIQINLLIFRNLCSLISLSHTGLGWTGYILCLPAGFVTRHTSVTAARRVYLEYLVLYQAKFNWYDLTVCQKFDRRDKLHETYFLLMSQSCKTGPLKSRPGLSSGFSTP